MLHVYVIYFAHCLYCCVFIFSWKITFFLQEIYLLPQLKKNSSSTSFCLRSSSCRTDLSIYFQPSRPTTIWMFFFLVTLTLSLVHSTMRQTTESVNWRSVVDTAVWDFLNLDARFTRDSNPGLQHGLHAPQARALPLTPPWRQTWPRWLKQTSFYSELNSLDLYRRSFCVFHLFPVKIQNIKKYARKRKI